MHVDLGGAGDSSGLAKVREDHEVGVSVFLVLHFLASSSPLAQEKKKRKEAHMYQKDVEIVYVLFLAWCQQERLGDLGTIGTLFIESRSSGFCIFDVGM